jgi:hypothetical protein
VWFFLPQAVSRLSSIYVFAAVAHRANAGQLGALALATAFSSASLALAPAVVGKPLAALSDPAVRRERAPLAHSAAVLGSVAVALALAPLTVVTHGLVRLALLGGVLGVPAVMIVESSYWRSVFVAGPRAAGLSLSAAYGLQAVVVTAAAAWLPARIVVIAPFAGLGLAALMVIAWARELTTTGALRWLTTFRGLWLPYVVGVGASVALVQTIPVALSATAGFASASTYRAGELAFGGTNLLIGVSSQTLLTQDTKRPREVYVRVSAGLVLAAGLNALAIQLAPRRLLDALIGPTAPLLVEVLAVVTVQRAALAVSSIGAILLLPLITARKFGLLDVVAAGTSLALLVIGCVVDGLAGGLAGLAIAEVFLAVLYARLLRRST